MSNKVRYNLKNVHYAVLTMDEQNNPSWGTPVHMPGAVSLSLSAEGSISPFHADGIVYYNSVSNNGYSGDLEMALIPESYRVDVLGEEKDASGVLLENSFASPKPHALLFEFDGDEKSIRHVLYNTTATRPSMEGETTTDTKEPNTESLSLSATPLPNGTVKARTGDDIDEAVYNAWYSSVWVKGEAGVG